MQFWEPKTLCKSMSLTISPHTVWHLHWKVMHKGEKKNLLSKEHKPGLSILFADVLLHRTFLLPEQSTEHSPWYQQREPDPVWKSCLLLTVHWDKKNNKYFRITFVLFQRKPTPKICVNVLLMFDTEHTDRILDTTWNMFLNVFDTSIQKKLHLCFDPGKIHFFSSSEQAIKKNLLFLRELVQVGFQLYLACVVNGWSKRRKYSIFAKHISYYFCHCNWSCQCNLSEPYEIHGHQRNKQGRTFQVFSKTLVSLYPAANEQWVLFSTTIGTN